MFKGSSEPSGRHHYTHFWATNALLEPSLWNKIVNDCRRVTKLYEDEITGLEFKKDKISFRGIDEILYDEFVLTRDSQSFVFCRTNWLPFDGLVTSCLLIAKKHAPGWIKLTSDGLWADWEISRGLLTEVLEYEINDFKAAKQDFDELLDKEDVALTERTK